MLQPSPAKLRSSAQGLPRAGRIPTPVRCTCMSGTASCPSSVRPARSHREKQHQPWERAGAGTFLQPLPTLPFPWKQKCSQKKRKSRVLFGPKCSLHYLSSYVKYVFVQPFRGSEVWGRAVMSVLGGGRRGLLGHRSGEMKSPSQSGLKISQHAGGRKIRVAMKG